MSITAQYSGFAPPFENLLLSWIFLKFEHASLDEFIWKVDCRLAGKIKREGRRILRAMKCKWNAIDVFNRLLYGGSSDIAMNTRRRPKSITSNTSDSESLLIIKIKIKINGMNTLVRWLRSNCNCKRKLREKNLVSIHKILCNDYFDLKRIKCCSLQWSQNTKHKYTKFFSTKGILIYVSFSIIINVASIDEKFLISPLIRKYHPRLRVHSLHFSRIFCASGTFQRSIV